MKFIVDRLLLPIGAAIALVWANPAGDPIVPFLPHEARREVFVDPPADDAVHHFEHQWALAQAVLFCSAWSTQECCCTNRIQERGRSWRPLWRGVPLGILLAVGLAYSAGLRLPGRMSWRHLVVVAFATSSGFTFALLFASSVLPPGPVLTQIKIGALLSGLGALVAFGAALGPTSDHVSPTRRQVCVVEPVLVPLASRCR